MRRIVMGVLIGSALGILLIFGSASAGTGCGDDFEDRDCSPVPEPGSLVLLTAGLGGLAWWLRKQR